jgi:CHAT domain-containing protein
LQAAQNWMRQATVDELLELLLPLKNEPEPVGGLAAQFRTELMGREPEERPFAHPYFWAPFTVSGL